MSEIPRVLQARSSSAQMSAKEVFRLALESISAMDQTRRQAAGKVWEVIKNEECTHFFGLVRHKRWPNQAAAAKYSQVYKIAANCGWGDYETCEVLRDFAQALIAQNPEAIMTITAEDFRALA